jgi:photoactive yellow protein
MSNDEDNPLGFSRISLVDLDRLDQSTRNALPFGVVGLSASGLVEIYNETESRLAGLSPESVIGAHYFSTTAQCMNNFMVAQHFEDEMTLDLTINYVLTLRMRPTPVRLRLLKGSGSPLDYILIQRL